MSLFGDVLGAVAPAVVGGLFGSSAADTSSKAAKQAAAAEVEAAQIAADTQLEMFRESQARSEPWRQAGLAALPKQMFYAGVPTPYGGLGGIGNINKLKDLYSKYRVGSILDEAKLPDGALDRDILTKYFGTPAGAGEGDGGLGGLTSDALAHNMTMDDIAIMEGIMNALGPTGSGSALAVAALMSQGVSLENAVGYALTGDAIPAVSEYMSQNPGFESMAASGLGIGTGYLDQEASNLFGGGYLGTDEGGWGGYGGFSDAGMDAAAAQSDAQAAENDAQGGGASGGSSGGSSGGDSGSDGTGPEGGGMS